MTCNNPFLHSITKTVAPSQRSTQLTGSWQRGDGLPVSIEANKSFRIYISPVRLGTPLTVAVVEEILSHSTEVEPLQICLPQIADPGIAAGIQWLCRGVSASMADVQSTARSACHHGRQSVLWLGHQRDQDCLWKSHTVNPTHTWKKKSS
jgi:hypothetical protein